MKKDSEIWENFKTGDQSALSYIYFQYFNSMFQYGVRFKDDPEFIKDCIQDVFFKLIQAGEKLSPTENIRFYLFKALKNAIYKGIDKGKKMQLVEFVSLKFDSPFALEEELAEKENVSNREMALLKALNELSGRQREIIYLRYECGMEYDQICEIMQLKSDSARKLVFRAIKSLKEIIEGQFHLPILFFIRFSNKYAL
ncbi:MAG: sigma-70 family RNA polymerase sigma factor [Ignavibacteria bacterium]|nr:sigma-70 family RNA polymerase sigma factor [Ignavibacteria bacterium]